MESILLDELEKCPEAVTFPAISAKSRRISPMGTVDMWIILEIAKEPLPMPSWIAWSTPHISLNSRENP